MQRRLITLKALGNNKRNNNSVESVKPSHSRNHCLVISSGSLIFI